jgi:hypothetical protein
MLFKILKPFGLDIPAKVDAAKALIEQRVEEVADYAKEVTQTAALVTALSAFAGIFAAMAASVALFALYRVIAENYGVNAGLSVVAGVLIAAAVVLFLIARTKGGALSQRPLFKPLRPPQPVAASDPAPDVISVPARVPSMSTFAPPLAAGDLLEPLAFLLAKYVKIPTLGYPMLDEFVGNLRVMARGTTEEAVERAADLVRYGNRGQLFILVGGAAVAGWLLARQSPDERLHDVTPAG